MPLEDGPNDVKKYLCAHLKVMHLLKQPTKRNPSLPRLVQEIVKAGKLGSMFMVRVARRSYGLLNDFAPSKEVEEKDHAALGQALLATAIVNLADNEFAKSTPPEKVHEWARENRDRWHGQIERWKPKAIVCGGTFDAVWRALGTPAWSTASTGMEYFEDPDVPGCVYLKMSHPTARYPVAMTHTYLMTSAREILEAP